MYAGVNQAPQGQQPIMYNPYQPQAHYPQASCNMPQTYVPQNAYNQQGNYAPQTSVYPQQSYIPPAGFAAYQAPMSPQQSPTNTGNPISDLFISLDRSGNGRVEPSELRDGLSRNGVQFSLDTAHRVVKMFDSKGDNQLDMREFTNAYRWIVGMHEVFVQIDTSRNGLLDGQEVRQALRTSGYQFHEEVFQLLMRKVDKERRMQLSFSGYLDLCIYIGYSKNCFNFYDRQKIGQVTFDFEHFLAAMLSTQL